MVHKGTMQQCQCMLSPLDHWYKLLVLKQSMIYNRYGLQVIAL